MMKNENHHISPYLLLASSASLHIALAASIEHLLSPPLPPPGTPAALIACPYVSRLVTYSQFSVLQTGKNGCDIVRERYPFSHASWHHGALGKCRSRCRTWSTASPLPLPRILPAATHCSATCSGRKPIKRPVKIRKAAPSRSEAEACRLSASWAWRAASGRG